LKRLNIRALEQLAQEIRDTIIQTVARNGGHLAPNLGVVELTLALHLVFDSPRDRIVWDVGHQTYAHKLITGRRARFATLRRRGGLSGYPRPSESPHDHFGTGHASTAISAALGMAVARDLAGEDHAVVAVVGDGALTGGMALEALNHAGHLAVDLIVVLNDNSMSIAPTLGALAGYLARVRSDPTYHRVKEEMEQLIKRIPRVGDGLAQMAERMKGSLKYLVVPGMLFEELGFTYLGPVDGHNLGALQRVLTRAREIRGPVLVHAVTKKGRGYRPAEESPETYHGVASGAAPKGLPTFSQVFGNKMLQLAANYPRLVAVVAAMPEGTGLGPFSKQHPHRFFDVGIAEQHAVTFAAGLAKEGWRPVVAIYSTFLQRAYDQIAHDVCLQQLPVIFALDRAGLVGEDGPTHHGALDLCYLRSLPHMVVMVPKDGGELEQMLELALSVPGPVAIRYPRGAVPVPLSTGQRTGALQLGSWEVLREGTDGAFLATGPLVYEALAAAEMLERDGLRVAVVNCRFVEPPDFETAADVATKAPVWVTVEDNVLWGGFGSRVLEMVQEAGWPVRVVRKGLPRDPVEHGTRQELLADLGLDASGLRAAMMAALTGGEPPWAEAGAS